MEGSFWNALSDPNRACIEMNAPDNPFTLILTKDSWVIPDQSVGIVVASFLVP
jgi:hypothetical protein